MIILIVVWLLLTGVLFYLGYIMKTQYEQKIKTEHDKLEHVINAIKVKLPDDSNTKQKNIIIELTPLEQTRILESRLIAAGQAFCVKCGRVAGLRYIKDGRPVGCTIQNVNGEKRCQDCLNKK